MTNVDVDITNIGVALFNRYFLEVAVTALGVGRSQLELDFIFRYDKYKKLTLKNVEKALCDINVPKMTLNEFYALLGIKRAFGEKFFNERKIVMLWGLPVVRYVLKEARSEYVAREKRRHDDSILNFREFDPDQDKDDSIHIDLSNIKLNFEEPNLDKDDFMEKFPRGNRRDEYRKFRKIILENPELSEAEILKLLEKEDVK